MCIRDRMLGGDHYKWRQMRAFGIDEKYICGDASDYDKFLAYARMLPAAIGNPLYHWTHLELRRVFGIEMCIRDSPSTHRSMPPRPPQSRRLPTHTASYTRPVAAYHAALWPQSPPRAPRQTVLPGRKFAFLAFAHKGAIAPAQRPYSPLHSAPNPEDCTQCQMCIGDRCWWAQGTSARHARARH